MRGGICLSFEEKLMLAGHARGDVVLCDLSGEADQDKQLLLSMDQIIAVIDPMPSKMLSGHKNAQHSESSGNGEQICDLCGQQDEQRSEPPADARFPPGPENRSISLLSARKNIYTAEYNCKVPYTVGEVRSALHNPLGEIASALLFL